MSFKHVHLIVEIKGLTSSQSIVLVWLTIHANDEGLSWPGIPLLMQETRLKKRTVQYALQQLEAHNLIIKSKGTYATHYRTVYFMMYAKTRISTPVEPPPPPPATNGTPRTRRNDLIGLFSSKGEQPHATRKHNH